MVSNDDMDLTDITPEDLGCMGEQEADPGVKEETQSIKAHPTTKDEIFASIPHETKKTYRKVYDGFEFKDMSFNEFCVEMAMISSPGLAQQSLSKIISQKHEGQMRKAGIDHMMKKSKLN